MLELVQQISMRRQVAEQGKNFLDDAFGLLPQDEVTLIRITGDSEICVEQFCFGKVGVAAVNQWISAPLHDGYRNIDQAETRLHGRQLSVQRQNFLVGNAQAARDQPAYGR